jgi:hypothetical protein
VLASRKDLPARRVAAVARRLQVAAVPVAQAVAVASVAAAVERRRSVVAASAAAVVVEQL